MTSITYLAQDESFLTQFRGTFKGLLSWQQLDDFWIALRARMDAGWYIYAVGQEPPHRPLPAAEVEAFIREIDALLRREHEEDYCGIVYADNVQRPTFVKIFDPHNLGVACGSSKNPPLPGWIMSLSQPVTLEARPQPGNRRRWWQALWAG